MFRKSDNRVEIEGYLKDNTLAYDGENKDVVKGYVTILVEEGSEFRIQYYANRFKKAVPGRPAEKNKMFEAIERMIADTTTSLAKVMNADSSATFETCKNDLTKVIAIGQFQEYLRNNREGQFDPIITIKGMSLYNREVEKFEPHACFDIEVFIDSKREEMKDGEPTGRLILNCLAPDFSNGVSEISFIAPAEYIDMGDGTMASVAQFIDATYEVNDTVRLKGDIVNTRKEVLVKKAEASFGRQNKDIVRTEFINERVIYGGSPRPIAQGEKDCFTIEDIKEARAKREESISKIGSTKTNNTRGFGSATDRPAIITF